MVDTGLAAAKTPFFRLCLKGSNPVPNKCKIILIGQSTGPLNDGKPVYVLSPEWAAQQFGANSPLAEMVRRAWCICPGSIYAAPLEGVGTAAEHTLTLTGPSTENGTITVSYAGYSFTVVTAAGDAASVVAADLAAAISANTEFPFTATAAGDDVVFTSVGLGEVGNQFALTADYGETGIDGTLAMTAIGAGAPDVQASLDQWGSCCYDCWAYEGFDQASIDILTAAAEDTWKCAEPQCQSRLYYSQVDTIGDLAIYLEGRSERAEAVIPVKDGYQYIGYQLAAEIAARVCCACCADPGRPVQFGNGQLCLTDENDCMTGGIWTPDEKEALAQLGGLIWDASGNGVLQIELYQTTWKTNANGLPDVTWTNGETRCVVKDFADKWRTYNLENFSDIKIFTDGTRIPPGQNGTTPAIYRNEAIAFLRDEVGITIDDAQFDQFVEVSYDPVTGLSVCISPSFVNQLKNIRSCINVDVLDRFAN